MNVRERLSPENPKCKPKQNPRRDLILWFYWSLPVTRNRASLRFDSPSRIKNRGHGGMRRTKTSIFSNFQRWVRGKWRSLTVGSEYKHQSSTAASSNDLPHSRMVPGSLWLPLPTTYCSAVQIGSERPQLPVQSLSLKDTADSLQVAEVISCQDKRINSEVICKVKYEM